ncbi:hypothetical protein BGZ58_009792 [Dissophora ornata]|nr:hypothetical protein BGZ58_009792 [Dissophora ornata]
MPTSTRRTGFAQLNDALYIEGGFDSDTTTQFVSLDLSTSWSSSTPAWSILPGGQSAAHLALAPISSTANGGAKGSLMAIGGMGAPSFFSFYDVSAGSWSNMTTVKPPYTYLEGQAAVSDPNTGLVYIVGGYGNNTYNQLSVYDPNARSMVSQAAATAATSLTDVGAVWVSSRNTVLTFGGSRAPPANTSGLGTGDLNEYDPSTKTWKVMSTSGDIPPARLDHCMAASADGSKVVLFGGTVDGNTFFSTIYILDVSSGKWKQGQSAPTTRTRMACAFHSYQFVAWGGSSGSSRTTILSNSPVTYNLNQNTWTDNYNANEKQKTTNVGAVVGGIVAVVVIFAGVGVFWMKKRQRRREEDAAFRSDAMAAAAMSHGEQHLHDDSNVKVLANEYPLDNVGTGAVGGYHDGSSTTALGGASADNNDRYYTVTVAEKISSPYNHPYSPVNSYGSAAATQSPPVAYIPHSPDPNPFMSPYEHSSATPTQSPFMTANYDPFQQYQQPTNYQGQPSPSPGARSPQAIPESSFVSDANNSSSSGYVPPPLM